MHEPLEENSNTPNLIAGLSSDDFYSDAKVFSIRIEALSAALGSAETLEDALRALRDLFSDPQVLPVFESHLLTCREKNENPDLDLFGTLKLSSTGLETAMRSINDAYCFGAPSTSALALEALHMITKRLLELGAAQMSAQEQCAFLKDHALPMNDGPRQIQALIDEYMDIDRAHDTRPALSEFAALAATKLAEAGLITSDFGLDAVMPIDLQISEDVRTLLKNMPEEVREALGDTGDQVRAVLEAALVRSYGVFNRAQEGKIPPLSKSIDDRPVLLVYGAVLDRRYDLKSEQRLKSFLEKGIEKAADTDSVSKADVIRGIHEALEAATDPVLDSATNVLAMLIRRISGKTSSDKVAFKPDTPGKPSRFETWLDEVANQAGIDPQDTPGGGSIQMARGAPRENVVIFTNRLNDSVANALSGSEFSHISYMRITPEGIKIMPIGEAGSENDPQEIGRPFETAKDISVRIEEEGQILELKTAEEKIIFGSALPKDTPIFRMETPGKTGDDKELASDEMIRTIGRMFKVVIVNGVHYSKGKCEETLAHQLDVISNGHEAPLVSVELSGVAAVPNMSDPEQVARFRKSMDYIEQVLSGKISSLSMNFQELGAVLTAVKLSLGEPIAVQEGDGAQAVYHNAESLARAMKLERLHIHGENFDLTLRRNCEPLDLHVEWLGNVYQKYGVIARVMTDHGIVPNPDDPKSFLLPPNLKREGMRDILQLAAALASSPSLCETMRKERISSLVRNGYYFNPDGYSIVVNVPKWAYAGTDAFRQFSGGREKLSLTGSGDTAAALSAILCRMKESRESKLQLAVENGF